MAKLLNPREEEGDRCPLFGEGDSVFAIIKATGVSIEKEASARGIETVPLPKSGFYSPTATPLQVLEKFAILLRCFDIAPCPAGDVRLLIERQLPANFCGRAEH